MPVQEGERTDQKYAVAHPDIITVPPDPKGDHANRSETTADTRDYQQWQVLHVMKNPSLNVSYAIALFINLLDGRKSTREDDESSQ
ncbi:hypothetical protein FRC19_008053 [Serendipita sp. 401]|nr:hypothetical protein FRC19_008053 [Serendipita sp. 401]